MNAPFLRGRCLDGRAYFAGWLGLILAGMTLASGATIKPETAVTDARAVRLEGFFNAYRCPGPLHIADYLRAADTYGIDYRLLPALSIRESTCGRHARGNNQWGWASARVGFPSVSIGIEYVARQLALGRYYRGKTLEEKLRMYNPSPLYATEIRKLMREIQDEENVGR
jgi:hypothetical protein